MIPEDDISLKKVFLWCLIVVCSMVALVMSVVSFLSVWVGFSNMHEKGFWMPVLSGSLLGLVSVISCLWAIRRLLLSMRDEDIFSQ